MRLDVFLFQKGLCKSRTLASVLIKEGSVLVLQAGQFKVVKAPSFKVSEQAQIKITDSDQNKYVSRGGLKLEGALGHLGLSVDQLKVLDIGLSTGGFADCLLKNGAEVVGIDVGEGQLAAELVGKVKSYEGLNIKDLGRDEKFNSNESKDFDLVVVDVSFISLSQVFPQVVNYLRPSGHVLSLVKPQFEVGKANLGKNGIVTDESLFLEVQDKINKLCDQNGLNVLDYFSSSIFGKKGNKEFFVYAKKN